MLYPEIMTVWDHTTSKEKPRSGVGGSEPRGLRTTYPPCKNERLERVELWPFFTYYMNQINLFFECSFSNSLSKISVNFRERKYGQPYCVPWVPESRWIILVETPRVLEKGGELGYRFSTILAVLGINIIALKIYYFIY